LVTINNTTPVAKLGYFPNSTNTQQNRIRFTSASGSNDTGAIIHETSGTAGDIDQGVIHLMPSDNFGNVDYVTVRATTAGAADTIKIFTSGLVTSPSDARFRYLRATSANPGTDASPSIQTPGGIKVGKSLNMNDQEIVNVKAMQFQDFDSDVSGTNNTATILRRDGRIQIDKGGLYVGAAADNAMPDGQVPTGNLFVHSKSYTGSAIKAYQSRASNVDNKGGFVPVVVYAKCAAGGSAGGGLKT